MRYAGSDSFTYDCNGNMTSRREGNVTYTQEWTEENRLKRVTGNGQDAQYFYDGDGNRVKKVQNGQTTVYLGAVYEKNLTTGKTTSYYFAGSQRVAMCVQNDPTPANNGVFFLHSDHLGSASLTTDVNGQATARQLYDAWGNIRPGASSGTMPTDVGYTGQRRDSYINLYEMGARWYSPALGRWLSPDTIVPDPANPQSLNRLSYVYNNPLRYRDPTGHDPLDEEWVKAFEAYHDRSPDTLDRLIRLFSIAFPDEWDWNKFYTSDGQRRDSKTIEKIFRTPGENRSWAAMPDVLERLAGWYKPDESEAFVRDVGALFGGLPTRFVEPSTYAAVTHNSPQCKNMPCHFWAHVNKEGLEPQATDDLDANVHHWAWSLVLGYHYRFLGVSLNSFHELPGVFNCQSGCRADLILGTRGALMGLDISFLGHSQIALQRAWRMNMYLPFW